MAHKEWEPDEFLDEFLDFDYKKPVPGKDGKHETGSPAGKVAQTKAEQKRYGLGDDMKEYESLRRAESRNAGKETPAKADEKSLRSSGAKQVEILEPLSARRPSVPAANTAAERKQPEPISAPADTTRREETSNESGFLSKFKGKNKHPRASEFAAGALDVAKKLVTTEEDMPPEEIPSAAARASGAVESAKTPERVNNRKANATAVKEKDELSELFKDLGETPAEHLTSEDNEALKQAQQSAYDRYRSNYLKKFRKKRASGSAGPFARWLSRIYVVALIAFAGMMTILNVLPFGMLIAFYIALGLLSIIIVMQLRKSNVNKWVRGLASVTAILLITGFGVGTAYSLGTLSFLDFTSVENANKVGAITKEPFNVCITGMDVNGKIDEQGRSDVNMIVTVNPKTEQILMTSIPRDYQIYMPDKDNAMDKLTHTGFYSIETTIGAEEQLLDTKVNYYVKVNFTTVKKFIDAIGGVDVYSEYEFVPVKMKSWTVQKGWNHMNGKQALAFARERKAFIDGDNQRIKNQQAVLEAIIKKATSSKTMLLSYNKILSNLRDYFQMSFSSSELRSLFKMQLAKSPEWKIYKNTIVGGNGSMPTYTTGGAYAYVMTQDEYSIENAKTLINGVLEGKMLDKDDDDNVYVTGGEETAEGENGE